MRPLTVVILVLMLTVPLLAESAVSMDESPPLLDVRLERNVRNDTLILKVTIVIINSQDRVYLMKKISDPVLNITRDHERIATLRLHAPDEMIIHRGENIIASLTISLNTSGVNTVSVSVSSGIYSLSNPNTGEEYNLSVTRRSDILLKGIVLKPRVSSGKGQQALRVSSLNPSLRGESSTTTSGNETINLNWTLTPWSREKGTVSVKPPFNPSRALHALAMLSVLAAVLLIISTRSLLEELLLK